MSKKIVVPESIVDAVARKMYQREPDSAIRQNVLLFLQPAFEHLAENPIVPTDEQIDYLNSRFLLGHLERGECYVSGVIIREIATEVQRVMFVDAEPEVPEAVRVLLYGGDSQTDRETDSRILEAYRRGKEG